MAELKRIIRFGQIEVVDALAEQGLPGIETLRTALLIGEKRRDACTALDPRIIPGIVSWGTIVRSLREQLIPQGWTPDEEGLSLIINPSNTIAIAVKTGDEFTGIATENPPKTKRPVGNAAVLVVEINRRQLELFATKVKPFRKAEQECLTWFLLRRRYKNQAFAELSLPDGIDAVGNILGWVYRIILDPISLDPETGSLLPDDGGDGGGDGGVEIDVSVSRR